MGEDPEVTVADRPSRLSRVTALPLVGLVRLYQVLLSPLLAPRCRYYPSCSAYAVTALQRYGPFKGSWLSAYRLLRCNPWSRGGVDHVPERRPAGPAGSPATPPTAPTT